MPLQPIYMVPGINKSTSPYSDSQPFSYAGGRIARGRFTDGNHTRFVAGFPEKLAGWVGVVTSGVTGIPRALRAWRDNNSLPRLAIGTETHLYYYDGTNLVDVTPLRVISTGTLTNPLSTTVSSTTVSVADSAQTLANGDFVYLSAASAVGGLTINGWYMVSSVSGTGYNITSTVAATSTASAGGGTTSFQYPRVTLSNPFTTTSGSKTVTVLHNSHGATTNEYVDFANATAVGGLTLNGEFQLTVVDSNHYTITAASTASSSATGGGSVQVTYDIVLGQYTLTTPVAYGVGAYGLGPYGYSATAVPTKYVGWTLAPYGDQLLACPVGGTIYIYDPVQGGRAFPLLNAPTDILAMLITPERFVVALGTATSSLQMAWADQNDYTNWTSSATNTANSGRTVQGGSYFVGSVPVRDGVSLAFTDRYVFQLNYSGDNYVYDSPAVADNAGLISPFSVVAQGEAAYWMGDSDFWTWNGTVQPLPSDDIRDYVFMGINKLYAGKCCAGLNRRKKEVWFFYPSTSATEIDSYVIYHIDQGCWSIGKLQRTAWVDADLFSTPFGADANGIIYQHETGNDDNGSPMDAYLTFAPTDISGGSLNMDMFGFIPDFERQTGNVSLTIQTQYYPASAVASDGPYTIAADGSTPRIDLRSDGKMIGFELESNVIGGDFRLALVRVDAQPSGARN